MKILAIDTSTPEGSVALGDGQKLRTKSGDSRTHYSSRLYQWLTELSEEVSGFATIDGIVITSGPGTFTGLRVGLATAKGISMGLGCPVAGFDTLETLAAAHGGHHTLLRPCINAGRGELYTALFTIGGDGLPERLEENRIVEPESFSELLRGDVLLCGNGIALLEKQPDLDIDPTAMILEPLPLAPALIRLAQQTECLASAKPDEYPALNYMRAPVG